MAGHEVVSAGALSQPTDCLAAVVRQALAVRPQDHNEIQHHGRGAAARPETLAYQARREESAAAGTRADPLGASRTLVKQASPPGA
jgi:hypothetical protein